MRELGRVPAGWRLVRLGKVLEICRNGLVCPQDAEPSKGIPVSRIETISDGTIDWRRIGHASPEHADPSYLVLQGDILLSHINSVRHIGKVARKQDERPLIHGMNLMLLRFSSHVDASFGFALLEWYRTKQYFERRAKKAVNQASINQADIRDFEFALPPLYEQRAIAAVLDAVGDAIERAEAVISATERLRDALLHELLTRGVPGWHTQWREVPGLGTIPADWQVVRLGDAGCWLSGGTPSKARADFWSGALPWVSPKDMKARELCHTQNRISLEGARAGSRIVPEGTIFVVVRGMILAHSFPLAVSRVAAAFNQDIRALICRDGLLPDFVLAALEQQKPRLLHLPSPSTHGTMRVVSEELFATKLPVPSPREQGVIAAVLGQVDDAIARTRENRIGLEPFKASAAESLLTGRIRLPHLLRA